MPALIEDPNKSPETPTPQNPKPVQPSTLKLKVTKPRTLKTIQGRLIKTLTEIEHPESQPRPAP